ncbi:MAG TPA: hypothetical protein VIE16_04065 [Phenylobacterium sp.]|jgi:hypothetical protein
MTGATTVAGIVIPSTSPVFLSVVAIHVLAGLVCVPSGAVAMFSPKRRGRHPAFGTIYFWGLAVVFVTAAVLSGMRWAEDHVLFALGGLAFASAYLGRRAMRRRWPNWAGAHLTGMGLSYILLVTAFYVDNGKNLPLWRRLPAVAYWLLPGLVGVPIIVNAYWRHPLVRQPASKSSADA